jgi:thiamine pyrophosphokinase
MKISQQIINFIGPMSVGHIDNYPSVIIDGGDKHFYTGEVLTHLGDFDSAKNKPKILLDKEKDFSDLCYALGLITSSVSIIHAHGFNGGRPDHQLANYLETYKAFQLQKNLKMNFYSSDSLCAFTIIAPGDYEFRHSGLFSIFTLNDQVINLQGDVDYKLNKSVLNKASSHGLSNNCNSKFQITNTDPVLIFFNY